MSLVKCQECGTELSTKATACPKCGAPVVAAKKRTSLFTWVVGGILATGIIYGLAKAPDDPTPTPLTAEEKQRADARNAQITRAVAATAALRKGMKNPDSFDLKTLVVKDDGAGCITYHATNAFNATLQSSAIFVPEPKAQLLVESQAGNRFVSAWNTHCTKAGGQDVTALAARIIK